VGALKGKVRLRAFAKVNYALEVRGLRDDGYHYISTVMQSISLADEVEIERSKESFALQVEPETAEVGPPEQNTIYKAWTLLCGLAGTELPARIRLHKKVPAGGGLGGGSADAAATLYGLNELYSLELRYKELCDVGSRIGADVPFGLAGGTALAEGVGEVITRLPAPRGHHMVVVKPEPGAETGGIYRAYDERPREGTPSVKPVVAALRSGDLSALARAVGNDLEPVTQELVPEVEEYGRELLRAGALGAAMSGSGTAVYGIFGSEEDAEVAQEKVEAPFAGVYEPVARGIERL
jgi:4-diphosphocytidyl-2-C-methyl-D-erythritol kinase